MKNGANNEFNYGQKITHHMFKKGKLMKSDEIGTWSAKSQDVNLKPGKSLDGVAATTVYRVATVLVK